MENGRLTAFRFFSVFSQKVLTRKLGDAIIITRKLGKGDVIWIEKKF